jgi:hypothetical protein
MKKTGNPWRWFEMGLLALVVLVHLYIATRPANTLMNWYTSDDGFYYFKVATNVSNGLGVTFDGLARTNGFHPLWMLVCIPVFSLARFDLVLPLRVLVMVSALLSAGTGLFIFRLLRKWISSETAAAMAVLWIFLPTIHQVVAQNGMETAISAFLLILLIYLVALLGKEDVKMIKLILLGIVAGLAILARLDNIYVVMLIGVWFALRKTSYYLRTVIVSDLGLIFIIGLLGYFVRLGTGPMYVSNAVSMPWHIVLAFILIPISLLFFGLYRSAGERITWNFLLRSFLAVTLAYAVIGVALTLFLKVGLIASLPRSVVLLEYGATLIGVIGLRLAAGLTYGTAPASEKSPLLKREFWKVTLPGMFGYFIPAVLLLGLFMLWSYWYVGTPMPISGQIKHWWSMGLDTVYGKVPTSAAAVLGLIPPWNLAVTAPWNLAVAPFAYFSRITTVFANPDIALATRWILGILFLVMVGCVFFLERKWKVETSTKMGLLPIFLGLYCQILYYTTTGYIHTRPWYWVGELLFTVLLLGVLLECVFLIMKRVKISHFLCWSALSLIFLAVFASFGVMLVDQFPISDMPGQKDAYFSEIHKLEDATENGAVIGQTGGGNTAYFIQDRTIVNLDGLISSPEYFQLLKSGQGDKYLNEIGLDYIFGDETMLTASAPYRALLKGHLIKIMEIDETTLFRYNPLPAQ